MCDEDLIKLRGSWAILPATRGENVLHFQWSYISGASEVAVLLQEVL